MKGRTLAVFVVMGLVIGFLVGWNRSNPVGVAAAKPASVGPTDAEVAAQQDKMQRLEQDLIEARNRRSAAIGTAAPVSASAADAKAAEPTRLDAFRALKAQGASVQVRMFGTTVGTGMMPDAKKFFGLTDDEAERASNVIANARRMVDTGATAEAVITKSDAKSITVTVPAADNAKDLRAKVAADLAEAVGSYRSQEILEIGAPEIDRATMSFGSTERTVTVTRNVVRTAPNGTTTAQFSLNERVTNGAVGTNFNNPQEKEEYAWLAKFNEQLQALTP